MYSAKTLNYYIIRKFKFKCELDSKKVCKYCTGCIRLRSHEILKNKKCASPYPQLTVWSFLLHKIGDSHTFFIVVKDETVMS